MGWPPVDSVYPDMNSNHWGLTPAELRKLRSFKEPYGIQRFLDDLPYHLEDTAWSPRRVLREARRIVWKALSSLPPRCERSAILR